MRAPAGWDEADWVAALHSAALVESFAAKLRESFGQAEPAREVVEYYARAIAHCAGTVARRAQERDGWAA